MYYNILIIYVHVVFVNFSKKLESVVLCEKDLLCFKEMHLQENFKGNFSSVLKQTFFSKLKTIKDYKW